jgi:hypothetical protein
VKTDPTLRDDLESHRGQTGDCRYAFFLSAPGPNFVSVNVVCTGYSSRYRGETAQAIYEHLDRYISPMT